MKRIIIMANDEVGVLADISKALGDASINIESIDAESAGPKGVVTLTTDDCDGALHVLKGAGFKAVTDDALVVRLRDEPGALARVAERFKHAGVNIRSLHILNRHAGHCTVALTADDRARAEALVDAEAIV